MKQTKQAPGFLSSVGTGLGTGLAQGLGDLAAYKLHKQLKSHAQEAETERGAKFWESIELPNGARLTPQIARNLASQPLELQRDYLRRIQEHSLSEREQGEQPNPMQAMQSQLGEQQQEPVQQSVQQQEQPAINQESAPAQDFHGITPEDLTPEKIKALEETIIKQQGENQPESKIENQPVKQPEQSNKFTLGKVSGEAGINKQERSLVHKDQAAINKEVHPYIASVQDKAKAAKENDLRLKRMEKLIENGKLNSPTFASLLQTLKNGTGGSLLFGHIGVDLENLLTADSQEFNKLSHDFIKNAKEIFGSRITDTDLKSFMKTVPTLSQSDSGKRAVIKNLKLMNQADEVRNKVARELLKEYGNNLPIDFQSEVEDRAKPELDKIAEKFNENVEKKPKKKGIFGGIFPNTGLFAPEE